MGNKIENFKKNFLNLAGYSQYSRCLDAHTISSTQHKIKSQEKIKMFDLIIRGALVVDPLNKINAIKDVAVAEGKITAIEDEISLPAKKLIEASGKS